ncbi:MAG: hypothetical protein IKL33_02685 [Alphaproteobacteria bacterium]|nr:hypothetical protein [Alphaproteobacteria bacterium]
MAWRPDKDNKLLNTPQYQDVDEEEALYLTKLFLLLLNNDNHTEAE